MREIDFDEWKKLDIRVGKILSVERIKRTEKLYKLKVDTGSRVIQIVSSLVPYYTIKELIGRKIIVLTNLKPTKFSGEVSEGMLLCAEKEGKEEIGNNEHKEIRNREQGKEQDKCVLLGLDKDIEIGTRIT